MAQYLTLTHGNAIGPIAAEAWDAFFEAAQASGFFKGGSELGPPTLLGNDTVGRGTDPLVGYMRFDAEDRQALLELLETHPVVAHGGTIELREMTES